MELHNLKPAEGAVKNGKRIARGQGSGRGGTSTRGHKGAKSRSGWSKKRNFEGGQMPLQMRLPKRGFKNPNRVPFTPINLGRISEIVDKYGVTDLSLEKLVELGIVKKTDKVKILATGELSSSITVQAHACSETAKAAIEAKGGTINII